MSNKPTDVLVHEHEVVILVVGAMECAAGAAREGRVSDAIGRMIEFAREFTDGCHHAKEERLLFPRLLEREPQTNGPITVMLREHDEGRRLIGALAGDLGEAHRGGGVAAQRVAGYLDDYAALLRQHIAKENGVLFPLAERVLSDDDKQWLAAEFDRLEAEETGEGAHEKYHALAHELAGSG